MANEQHGQQKAEAAGGAAAAAAAATPHQHEEQEEQQQSSSLDYDYNHGKKVNSEHVQVMENQQRLPAHIHLGCSGYGLLTRVP